MYILYTFLFLFRPVIKTPGFPQTLHNTKNRIMYVQKIESAGQSTKAIYPNVLFTSLVQLNVLSLIWYVCDSDLFILYSW